MKIVSITGFGYSGSSALKDLLKEYSEVQVLGRGEFQIFDPPDGIRDLEYHINQDCFYINNAIAIRRFLIFMKHNRFMNKRNKSLVDHYLKNFYEIKWRGRTGFEKGMVYGPSYAWWFIRRCIDELYRRFFHRYSNLLNTDFYISSPNSRFKDITKEFVDEFFMSYNADSSRIVAVDQLFPGIAPNKYFDYVKDPYCIVVDRDPRDVYIEAKRMNVNLIPIYSCHDFIKYFKLTRRKCVESERVLYIKFEDMIYNYDETVKKVESFLNIYDHKYKGLFFKPDESKRNTKLYLRYPAKDDMNRIKEELQEYLYE